MSPPTLWQHTRQILGRALRESGQALDRVGIKTAMLAVTPHDYYDDPVIYQDHFSRHRQLFPLIYAGRPVVHPAVAYVAPCATLLGSVRVGRGSSIWYGAVLRADACENAESFEKSDDELLQYVDSTSSTRSSIHSSSSRVKAIKAAAAAARGEGKEETDKDTVKYAAAAEAEEEEFTLQDDRFRQRLDRHGGGLYIGENTNVQDGCILTARSEHCRIGNGVTIGHLAQIHSATVEDFCLIGMGSVVNEGAYMERESFLAAGAVLSAGQVVKSGELWIGNPAHKARDLTAEERQRLHFQSSEYVSVATGHRDVMQLGGNLSESMLNDDDDDDDQQQQQQQQHQDTYSDESVSSTTSKNEDEAAAGYVSKNESEDSKSSEPVIVQKQEARVG